MGTYLGCGKISDKPDPEMAFFPEDQRKHRFANPEVPG